MCGAEASVKRVASEANGYLFEQLLMKLGYQDVAAAQLLRNGAQFLGALPRSGIGVPVDSTMAKSVADLREGCAVHNAALLEQLREETTAIQVDHDRSMTVSQALMEATRADAHDPNKASNIIPRRDFLAQRGFRCVSL